MLEELTKAIDALAAAKPATVADPDTLVALHRQLARLEAVITRAVGSFEAQQEYAPGDARSVAGGAVRRAGGHLPAAGTPRPGPAPPARDRGGLAGR